MAGIYAGMDEVVASARMNARFGRHFDAAFALFSEGYFHDVDDLRHGEAGRDDLSPRQVEQLSCFHNPPL